MSEFLQSQFQMLQIRKKPIFSLSNELNIFTIAELFRQFIDLYEGLIISLGEIPQQWAYFVYLGFYYLLKKHLQQSFLRFQHRVKSQYRSKNEFQIISKSLYGIFQTYKHGQDKVLVQILQQLKEMVMPMPYHSHEVMSFVIFFILCLPLPKVLQYHFSNDIIVQIINKYRSSNLYCFLLMNPEGVLRYIFANAGKGNVKGNFDLMHQITKFAYHSDTLESSFLHLFHLTLRGITLTSEYMFLLNIFEILNQLRLNLMSSEQIYSQAYIYIACLLKTPNSRRDYHQLPFQAQKIGKQIKRMHVGLKLMKKKFSDQLRICLLRMYRKFIGHHSSRKQKICLKLEGKYRLFQTICSAIMANVREDVKGRVNEKAQRLIIFDVPLSGVWISRN